jgi:predicted transport protein
MAKSTADMIESMKAGLLAKTGKPLAHWVKTVQASGIEKHGEQVNMLKTAHGLGHGHANFVCQVAKGRMDADPGEMLEAQYKGKEALRPIHDALVKHAASLGKDVSIDPKKTSVALRRSKNFAVIVPATKTRIDLGINLKGEPGTDRLLAEKPGSMCTHKVRLETVADVDADVKAWLKAAYARA